MYRIFAVSYNDNLWQLRHMFGIPRVQSMIESKRQKFFDRLMCDEKYTVVLNLIHLMCFKMLLIFLHVYAFQ